MDTEKIKRRQNLKVIISEIIMVIAVIATVAVLALVVSGYWINSDFEVERQGMVQVSSVPTGANLIIDDEEPSWFQRTNTSKILSAGEHQVTLTKDGYDSWSRKINISEGLLYRIHYPRLFLTERESEPIYNASKYTFATISPNRKLMLLLGDTTEWTLLNLDNDSPKPEKLDVTTIFSISGLPDNNPSPTVFTGNILDANWDKNNEHILFKLSRNESIEWVLLDVVNVKNSINLTREFSVGFDTLKIFDHSASNLLALENGNLRKIDTRNKTISATLAKNVTSFDYYDNEIIFSALNDTGEPYLGAFKINNSDLRELEQLPKPFSPVIFRFYDNKYIATLSANELTVHQKDDYEKISTFKLSFTPTKIEVGHNGEFLTMLNGSTLATLDMEDNTIREWTVDGEHFGWLDDDMIFSVKNGELYVYDFDGLNRRLLAKNVSSHFPVTITNDKWLYYFSDGILIRETINK